jgi:hypothetical protein
VYISYYKRKLYICPFKNSSASLFLINTIQCCPRLWPIINYFMKDIFPVFFFVKHVVDILFFATIQVNWHLKLIFLRRLNNTFEGFFYLEHLILENIREQFNWGDKVYSNEKRNKKKTGKMSFMKFNFRVLQEVNNSPEEVLM